MAKIGLIFINDISLGSKSARDFDVKLKSKYFLCFLILFILSFNLSQASEIQDKIKQNTFMFVPINGYAPVVTKAKAMEHVEANCHLANLPPSEKLNCKQLLECSDENKDCKRDFERHGTAFLMGDGQTLYTAWHVAYFTHGAGLQFAKNYASTQSPERQKEMFQKLAPMFVLLNHDFQVVYDTRLESQTKYLNFGDPLATVYSFDGVKQGQPFGVFENVPDDFVSIHLTKKLGEGLKQASNFSYDQNTRITTVGFGYDGHHLSFNQDHGHPESLIVLKRNSGLYLNFLLEPLTMSYEDFTKQSLLTQAMALGYSEESSKAQIAEFGEELISQSIQTLLVAHARHQRDLELESNPYALFTTNSVSSGQSGGPVFNDRDEVIGLIANSILDRSLNEQRSGSFGTGIHLFQPRD